MVLEENNVVIFYYEWFAIQLLLLVQTQTVSRLIGTGSSCLFISFLNVYLCRLARGASAANNPRMETDKRREGRD